MPRKTSATAELERLQTAVADLRVEAAAAQAKADALARRVDEAKEKRVSAYAADDEAAAAEAFRELEALRRQHDEAEAKAEGLRRRLEHFQGAVAGFRAEHGRALLQEREPAAREVTSQLNAAVHEALRLDRAYVAERQAQDQLVSAIHGAVPRSDGPPPEHAWESALNDLQRTVAQHPELEPPVPRWLGVRERERTDALHRQLRDRR